MQELQFPAYSFQIRTEGQKNRIFDVVRKKFIPLTPEEWVRQHVLMHLISALGVAPGKLAVERELQWNRMKKRFDVVVWCHETTPVCLVECKAPDVALTTETVIQAATYNHSLQCPWVWITNGIQHVWLHWNGANTVPAVAPQSLCATRN
ncbi:MAG: type I restriction enzyme HsdR N-terminal domain-containing protein [Bacteroidetes bacterium]|nr:type I restriction enzyme HsdR N-terminal domain-containing protein [Bacteroidota bacterium]